MNIMLSRLLRCFAAVLLVFSLSLPFAAGQDDLKVERGVKVKNEAGDAEEGSSSSPALPYVFLILYSMLVLTIVFMPSRKA